MNISIRWKLLASYLFLLVVTGGTLYIYLNRTLEDSLVEGIRQTLRSEAELAAFSVARSLGEKHQGPQSMAREIGRRINARVTIMTESGDVIGDSEVPAETLSNLENHRTRPEVAAALDTGGGSATRYSTTLKTQMLYMATRFIDADGRPAVLRLALPLSAVDRTKSQLHATLAVALGLASLLAIFLSLLLSGVATRTLRELTVGAARFGGGHFKRRLKVRSRDELGALTEVMNLMAERLQVQMESLANERNRLDAILRGMGEGLLVTDANGTVLLVNPAFHKLFDVSEKIVGHSLHEISRHPDLLATFREVVTARCEQTREVSLPEPGPTLLTHWVPLLADGSLTGVVAVFHDISDLKRLERIRRDFVANVSHELRTPVAVIRGYAETLASGHVDLTTSARFAATIQTHAERLTALIGDLLTLSELEANGAVLPLTTVDLAEVVQHCQQLLQPQAAQRQVAIDISAVPVKLAVLADRQRLEQVLINLLDNAIKYSPPAGIVSLKASTEDETIKISVRDSGPGIPLHEQARIFERFYRVDTGRGRDQGGTGLGLAIVRHIVQLHGGTVGVESIPGEGACFHVTLRRG